MRVAIGVDVGGTKTAAGVVGPRGELLRTTVRPTPARAGAAAVLATACDVAATLLAWARGQGHDVVGCGAGVAGTVDLAGVITHATDALPGWAGTDVASALAAATGLPARVVNDVHALALGEVRSGAAAGLPSALVVAVGTGIGGAFVVGGELVVGRTGTAGAIGHVPVVGESRPCPCGGVDHLEAYASGPAIVARYRERGGAAARLEDVVAAAGAGVVLARDALAEAGAMIGYAVAGAMNLLDPHAVVLGGGVVNVGPMLLDAVRREIAASALPGPRAVPVRTVAVPEYANVIGAASLVTLETASA
ncbi:ROK family protein [Xylanimonas cellulosilytica DSM 15894]|uniref:ROK family protein n=1 Tax=Xylanimonas cellulosilytica (strain DSM 15894 / JCM 12276 / CECT 5975 / KCTC 9989 / LMG 20990 / NBRC 107835 / XIL07) TaxID=446471 RepID=D1BUC6_XYLCX|nr:ROK family protein [Xylanimonas cellulosilytica]ACZ31139.1 ROK family protein [Xylanimonas cellulosilytica DSM 15894]